RRVRPLITEEFVPPPAEGPLGLPMLLQDVLKETFTGDAQSYRLLGLANEIGGKNDEALRAYLKGVQFLEDDRGHVDDEQGRLTFFEDKVGCYHAAIGHYLERKQFAEAFELMEKSRARVLADLLASRTPEFSDPKERDLDAQCRKLEAQIGVQQ